MLCATEFSVPQARKRIYIVAFRNDLNVQKFQFPQGKIKTVEDILEHNVDQRYTIISPYIIDFTRYNNIIRQKEILRVGAVGLGRQGERIYSIKGQD